MTDKNSQSGFSVLSLIATILVVTGIGLAGYYVWHKNQQQDKKQTISKSGSQTTQKSSESQSASDPTEGGKYFVIKEWGVRFPLSHELAKNLQYVVLSNTGVGETSHNSGVSVQGDIISFTSSDLASMKDSHCQLKTDGGAGSGAMDLFRSKDKTSMSTDNPNVDNQYYWYSKGNGGYCSSESDGTIEGDFVGQMSTALEQVEKY